MQKRAFKQYFLETQFTRILKIYIHVFQLSTISTRTLSNTIQFMGNIYAYLICEGISA